jgi:hypothetical protein
MSFLTSTALVAGTGLVRPANPWDASAYTWTTVIASTPEAWRGLEVVAANIVHRGPVHLAVGAAGAEQIIASVEGDPRHPRSVYLPVAVPAGSRLSTATAGHTTVGYDISVVGYPTALIPNAPVASRLDCGPFNLAGVFAEFGLLFRYDTGGATNVKGAWAEINPGGANYSANVLRGESIGQTYSHLGFCFRKAATWTGNNPRWRVDVAYGASGSETLILEDHPLTANSTSDAMQAGIVWVPWGRAPGDRISMRAECDVSDAAARTLDVILYGLR